MFTRHVYCNFKHKFFTKLFDNIPAHFRGVPNAVHLTPYTKLSLFLYFMLGDISGSKYFFMKIAHLKNLFIEIGKSN